MPDAVISDLELGLRRLLLHRVSRGTPITEAIDRLTRLMTDDPVAYARELARAIPGWEHHLDLPRDELAQLITTRYGRLARDRRTVWRYWDRTPASLRHTAEDRGEQLRANGCQ